jgi:hypothetical protein
VALPNRVLVILRKQGIERNQEKKKKANQATYGSGENAPTRPHATSSRRKTNSEDKIVYSIPM